MPWRSNRSENAHRAKSRQRRQRRLSPRDLFAQVLGPDRAARVFFMLEVNVNIAAAVEKRADLFGDLLAASVGIIALAQTKVDRSPP